MRHDLCWNRITKTLTWADCHQKSQVASTFWWATHRTRSNTKPRPSRTNVCWLRQEVDHDLPLHQLGTENGREEVSEWLGGLLANPWKTLPATFPRRGSCAQEGGISTRSHGTSPCIFASIQVLRGEECWLGLLTLQCHISRMKHPQKGIFDHLAAHAKTQNL